MSQELKSAKALLKSIKENSPIKKTVINGVKFEIYNNSRHTADYVRRIVKEKIDYDFCGNAQSFVDFYGSAKIKVTTYPTQKGNHFSTF